MERHVIRSVDKSGWGEGPWQHEPDFVQWVDAATGLTCMVIRHARFGSFNGYVGIPPGHPLVGVESGDLPLRAHGDMYGTADPPGWDETEYVPDATRPIAYWVGFDCGHTFDVRPGRPDIDKAIADGLDFMGEMMQAMAEGMGMGLPPIAKPKTVEYRDIAYVTDVVVNLARQVAALG